MRKVLLIAIICLFAVPAQSFSQNFVFKVLANKGQNVMRESGDGADWQPIRTGTSLPAGSTIQVKEGAYLGLIHSSGKTQEITKPGDYKVDDLAQALNANNGGVAAKYADFVLTKMTESDEDINSNHRQYLNVTGAVERAVDDGLKLMLPTSSKLFRSEAFIRWAEGEEEERYLITFQNMFDSVLMEAEIEDSSLKLDFDNEAFRDEFFVKVQVQVVGNEDLRSKEYGIERLSEGKLQALNSEVANIQADGSEESPLTHLVLAGFFEENQLYLDALTSYEMAIKLAPDVDSFRLLYEDFLVRTGLAGNTAD